MTMTASYHPKHFAYIFPNDPLEQPLFIVEDNKVYKGWSDLTEGDYKLHKLRCTEYLSLGRT